MADSPRRIGVLVAASDQVVEADLHAFLPKRVSFHTARLFQSLRSTTASLDSLTELANSAEPSAASVARAEPELILFACTAASMAKGRGWEREIAQRITAIAAIPAVTTAEAIVNALRTLALDRVFLLSPHTGDIAALIQAYIEAHGVAVTGSAELPCKTLRDVPAMSPAEIRAAILAHRGAIQRSGALLVCGSSVRVLGTIEDLERELGVPVVSSNQALLWQSLRRLRIDGSRIPLGRLLQAQALVRAPRVA